MIATDRRIEQIKVDLLSPSAAVRVNAVKAVFTMKDEGVISPSEAEEILDYGEAYRG